MKRLLIVLFLTSTLLNSCQQKENAETATHNSADTTVVADTPVQSTDENNETTQQDFLAALQDICVEDDGIFKNCDELFGPDGSYYFFLIIPKAGAQNWYNSESKNLKGATYEKNNALTAKIQKIDKSKLSNEFDVWVFYTDKKYTKHVGMDAPYNVLVPHVTDLYYLKSGKNNWEKQGSYNVNNDNDVQKEIEWRDEFINKATTESNQKVSATNTANSSVSKEWIGKYFAYFSYGDIAGQNAGWELDITITDGKITASGEGYQIAFLDELSATENGNQLKLSHLKNISGYKTGKNMSPEFTLIKDKGKFYVKSKWIDRDVVTKPSEQGYEIEKE